MSDELSQRRNDRPERLDLYPLHLAGRGRRALVVGGGAVAERKVRGALGGGLLVTVLAPDLTEGLLQACENGRIVWLKGRFPDQAPPIEDYVLVFACTNSHHVNQAVLHLCRQHQVLVNLSDDPESSDFINPAVLNLEEEGLLVTISTRGRSPARARELRETLEAALREILCRNPGRRVNPD